MDELAAMMHVIRHMSILFGESNEQCQCTAGLFYGRANHYTVQFT